MKVNSHETQSFAFRLSLFYAALFTGFGIYMPFFPVWLQSKALDETEIGLLLATFTLTRIALTPVATWVANKSSSLKNLLVFCAVSAAVTLPLLALADGFWPLAALISLTASFWGPLTPLSDTYAVDGITRRRLDYGTIRAWGSVAFLGAALGAGVLKTQMAPHNLIWLQWGTLLLLVAGAMMLPADHRPLHAAGNRTVGAARVLTPRFVAVILVSGLIQGSHALQYAFSSIHWTALGYSGVTIGLLWSVGVLSEIALFLWGRPFTARHGPLELMMFGAFAAVLRWALTSLDPPLELLLPLQVLHAGSFGLVHLGMIAYVMRLMPPEARAGGLGWSTVAAGFLLALLTMACGGLYAHFAALAYWAMALLALVGLIGAFWLRVRTHSSARFGDGDNGEIQGKD